MARNNMQKMMLQAQKMQADMQRVQAEVQEMVVEASAGGGVVKAKVKGDGTLVGLEISPVVVDPSDVEMLQDLVVAAVNDGYQQVAEISSARMAAVTGGMNIPGM